MGFTINATGVEARKTGEMVDPGTYRARIREVESFESRSGTPGIGVTFEVDAGPFKGGRVRDTVWLSDKALPFALGRFEAAGVKLDGEVSDEQLIRALTGKVCDIVVRPDEYEDRETGQMKESRKVVAWDKPQGSVSASLPTGPAAPVGAANDDDLPF